MLFPADVGPAIKAHRGTVSQTRPPSLLPPSPHPAPIHFHTARSQKVGLGDERKDEKGTRSDLQDGLVSARTRTAEEKVELGAPLVTFPSAVVS